MNDLYHSMGFPGGANGKEFTSSAGDARDSSSIPGPRRSPREGNGNPLQYSYLENSTEEGALCVIVHRVAKSQHLVLFKD